MTNVSSIRISKTEAWQIYSTILDDLQSNFLDLVVGESFVLSDNMDGSDSACLIGEDFGGDWIGVGVLCFGGDIGVDWDGVCSFRGD